MNDIVVNQIIEGNCEVISPLLPEACIDLIATDPPFNIGLLYNEYNDRRPYQEYCDWTGVWTREAFRVLKPFGSMYVLIGDEFAAEMKIALQSAGFTLRNWIIWAYGFGQNQRKKFSRCHTHILYVSKNPKYFTFNADAILVPSKRQTQYGDKRAKAGGKVPDDIWTVYADGHADVSSLTLYPDDLCIWGDSRLCGTFNERLKDMDGSSHICQMPLSIMERMVLASSNRGELVADFFGGSGTTPMAAQKHGRNFLAFERDPRYVELARNRLRVGAQPQ